MMLFHTARLFFLLTVSELFCSSVLKKTKTQQNSETYQTPKKQHKLNMTGINL